MLDRNFIIILFFFAKMHSYGGGISNKNKINLPAKEYEFNNSFILKLNEAFLEIPGISFYPKDSSVYALSDESSFSFKIYLSKNFVIEKCRLDKKSDYEDLFYKDSTFYVLESNRNIHTLNFSLQGDTIYTRKSIFPTKGKKKNEFESLFYDEERKGFIMLCKDCEVDKKNKVTAWGYNPSPLLIPARNHGIIPYSLLR